MFQCRVCVVCVVFNVLLDVLCVVCVECILVSCECCLFWVCGVVCVVIVCCDSSGCALCVWPLYFVWGSALRVFCVPVLCVCVCVVLGVRCCVRCDSVL